MTLNNFCPNNCGYLNHDEATQNLIHKATNKLHPHRCSKYNIQLYHEYYEPLLLKCNQCLSEQQNNNVKTNWIIFEDGHKKSIIAHWDFLDGDILFHIDGSDFNYLYKANNFNNYYECVLSNTRNNHIMVSVQKCFYKSKDIPRVSPLIYKNNEEFWFAANDVEHIELCDYKPNII